MTPGIRWTKTTWVPDRELGLSLKREDRYMTGLADYQATLRLCRRTGGYEVSLHITTHGGEVTYQTRDAAKRPDAVRLLRHYKAEAIRTLQTRAERLGAAS